MPINASPHFEKAQAEYEAAQTTEQKIICLKKMMALAPKHKGAENLRAQLKRRLAKLKYSKEKEDRSGKSTYKGIKKEDMQAALIGLSNSGKSALLSLLTNASPRISNTQFTTTYPVIGMMNYEGANIQLIELPGIDSEYYDKGLANTADTLLILITNLEQLSEIGKKLEKASGKRIIVFNKSDILTDNEKRKISATLQSKKYNFVMISSLKGREGGEALNDLKNKLLQSFDKIRVYTKEPGKEKSKRPIILEPNSTVKKVAEKILHGFSKNVKETKIWGPSSKFPGQKVGLQHKLKDLDVVEFKTR
jgi:small GTP-binding protein